VVSVISSSFSISIRIPYRGIYDFAPRESMSVVYTVPEEDIAGPGKSEFKALFFAGGF
jgi:hypothetical protein